MTAEEASKICEETVLNRNLVEEEIKTIDTWIGVAARNGRDSSVWWVPQGTTDAQVKEIVQHFKSKGFEASEEKNIVHRVCFTW